MKICYIVGAGDFAYPFIPKKEELVIAADGGYDTLTNHGIRCDVLVGDLDSVKDVPSDIKILKYKREKDETDIALAISYGASLGYTEFRIYGATGGRQDHTFANYSLLFDAKRQGFNAKIVSEGTLISAIFEESVKIYGQNGGIFSVFAFGRKAGGVSISGAKYSLENAEIDPFFPLGISNEFKDAEVEISVSEGALLLMQHF